MPLDCHQKLLFDHNTHCPFPQTKMGYTEAWEKKQMWREKNCQFAFLTFDIFVYQQCTYKCIVKRDVQGR